MKNTGHLEVLELLMYRLAKGVSPADFLATFNATAPGIEAQPGLLARTLAHKDGDWVEAIRWRSQTDADAAGQAIMADPAFTPLMSALDLVSLSMRFLPVQWHKDS